MEYHFTDANFEAEVLNSAVPVLVDCWAEWCGPCRAMGPVIEELAQELDASKIKIGKLNVDESPNTPGQFNVSSIPTFLLIKEGKVVDQFMGSMTKASLIERLKKNTDL